MMFHPQEASSHDHHLLGPSNLVSNNTHVLFGNLYGNTSSGLGLVQGLKDEDGATKASSSQGKHDGHVASTNGDEANDERPRNKGEKKVKRARYAFETRSQVDILDDGYRWRKYGQKAVKNNKFPRFETSSLFFAYMNRHGLIKNIMCRRLLFFFVAPFDN